MVKVPTRDTPQAELRTQAVDPRSAATLGGEVVNLAEGIGALGNQLQKMQDESYTNKAQAGLLNTFNDIHTQFATNSGDLTTAPQRAQEALDAAVNDWSNSIPSSQARNQFQQTAAIEKARKSTDMNNMFVGKSIKEAKFNMFNNVDSITKQAWNSTNPEQVQQAKEQIKSVVDKAIATGYINPEAGKFYLDSHLDKLAEGQVDHDMNLPDMAKTVNEELKKGGSGVYPDLKPSVREQKIKQSDSLVKKQENQQKEALKAFQSDNGNYLVTLSKEGKLTPQVIQEFGYTGRVKRSEFNSWMKKMDSPIIHGDTDATVYNDAIRYMTKSDTKTDDVREYLVDKLANNKLSEEDFHSLYEMHLRPVSGGEYQSLRNVYGKEQEMKDVISRHKNFMNSAVSLIEKYSPKNAEKVKSMISAWGSKTLKDSTPEDYPRAANDIIKQQRLIDNPDIASFPEDGRVMQDEDGYRANTTPDGGLSEEAIVQEDSDNAPSGF